MKQRLEVGLLGATGMVGQQFIVQLTGHPWFELVWLGASERSRGRSYREAASWRLGSPLPDTVADLVVDTVAPGQAPRIVFSALDASVAGEVEQAFAAAGHVVISNARNHRMDECVPLLIPEINPDHLGLLPIQTRQKGWSGAIVTNPNCSTVVLAMVVAPLRQFGLRSIVLTTLQAVSGAGYPGTPSLDVIGNVIPFIDGEEGKIETETQKILGCWRGTRVEPLGVAISAQTTRVAVVNGHTETISVGFETRPSPEELMAALAEFRGRPQELDLPTAPARPIRYLAAPDRPQPRLDADREAGMTVWCGRLRRCPVLDYKLVALGHNTIRGAAGAAVLNAELMVAERMVD